MNFRFVTFLKLMVFSVGTERNIGASSVSALSRFSRVSRCLHSRHVHPAPQFESSRARQEKKFESGRFKLGSGGRDKGKPRGKVRASKNLQVENVKKRCTYISFGTDHTIGVLVATRKRRTALCLFCACVSSGSFSWGGANLGDG